MNNECNLCGKEMLYGEMSKGVTVTTRDKTFHSVLVCKECGFIKIDLDSYTEN